MPRAIRVLLLILAMSAGSAPAQTAPDVLQALQGTWIVRTVEHLGNTLEIGKGDRLVIGGEAFALHTAAGDKVKGKKVKGKIAVRSNVTQQEIDFLFSTGQAWHGVFTTTANTLRLNHVAITEVVAHPKEFAAPAVTAGSVILMSRGSGD